MNEILIALLLFTYGLSVSARPNIATQSDVTVRTSVQTVGSGEHNERKTCAFNNTTDSYIDIKCMLIDTSLYKGCESSMKYSYESEQQVTGHVNTSDLDSSVYKILFFVPHIGIKDEFEVIGNHTFTIQNIDIVDGTTVILQAISEKGASVDIHITPQFFPNISVAPFYTKVGITQKLESNKLKNRALYNNIHSSIELPVIEVKGKRFTPKNRQKRIPDRGIPEGSPLFEESRTIETLLGRFALKRGVGLYHDYLMDEELCIEGIGRISGGTFVLSEVMMNEQLLIGYELSDVLNITPSDIEQIEYFLPTNHEMFGNLAGAGNAIKGLYGQASERGLLMIWTKSNYNKKQHDKNIQYTTIKPLGYMPQMEKQ